MVNDDDARRRRPLLKNGLNYMLTEIFTVNQIRFQRKTPKQVYHAYYPHTKFYSSYISTCGAGGFYLEKQPYKTFIEINNNDLCSKCLKQLGLPSLSPIQHNEPK